MRKRFWTTRKNKYKHKSRKQKKHRHKRVKTRRMNGGAEMPFSEISKSGITNSVWKQFNIDNQLLHQ